jgi:hypothetical protein
LGHFIQAIVAPESTARRLIGRWPELSACTHNGKHILFPIDAEVIDAKVAPNKTPQESDETFMLLTVGLKRLLADISEHGILAYVETEYHGGQGGQGAMVIQDGQEIMSPEWSESDTINKALRLLGIGSTKTEDEFLMLGLGMARNNDDLLDRLTPWKPKTIA